VFLKVFQYFPLAATNDRPELEDIHVVLSSCRCCPVYIDVVDHVIVWLNERMTIDNLLAVGAVIVVDDNCR